MAKKRKTKNNDPVSIESVRHKDKRKNIPTEELRDFVTEEEQHPRTMLYPRDPSLDPQLVWKGKDKQDREDLVVPVVPVYIQEKIEPKAIIEEVRRHAEKMSDKGERIREDGAAYDGKQDDFMADLFSDFNGLPEEFDQRVEFYKHDGHWSNRMILGDSLLVMTSLAEKEGLKGKVQCIYIDPPYGIKFGSNWQVSTRKREVKDGKAEDTTRQPEQVRAFRDTWKLGIHSYLAYLRDRLVVARELLTETGSVFVQIGDENVHLVRSLLDEVFGGENFIAEIVFQRGVAGLGKHISNINDFVLWYAKNKDQCKSRQLLLPRPGKTLDSAYNYIQMEDNEVRRLNKSEFETSIVPLTKRFKSSALVARGATKTGSFSVDWRGATYNLPPNTHWKTSKSGLRSLVAADRVHAFGKTLVYKMFASDFPYMPISNIWSDVFESTFAVQRLYVVQTGTRTIQRCLLMTTDPGDLVLDPTCGSGTTAYVAEQWGRRWITIDTSRVALALARTRLMAAKYPYYLLADSPEGIDKEAELTGKIPPPYKTESDIKKGFVYKRVPHITLKSIANNPDIKEDMTRDEIDQAIAQHAGQEMLYDQPYANNKTVRVTGPFTVESLSPHRILSTADEDMDGSVSEQEAMNQQDFATMILDNLRKAGVQNTKVNERLKFDTLDPYSGAWLHAQGTFIDTDDKVKRVAVSIGPEHGTVGPQQIKEAAKEAVQGVGFDLLIVCGFAFDPHVSEEVKRYGKLTVLPTQMNPDLAMGDELLKKTGVGNLFMVFGEPDLDIKMNKDGKLIAEIKGVDVYDPTTGEIRSSSTDDIACWFIDTNYNGESFFVRHAYFTGSEEPYKKLKLALRAEVDEDAWVTLYSTVSYPFDPPDTGKIAIKVINHYGDEVLKVYDIES